MSLISPGFWITVLTYAAQVTQNFGMRPKKTISFTSNTYRNIDSSSNEEK
jgi:hypothetical protein